MGDIIDLLEIGFCYINKKRSVTDYNSKFETMNKLKLKKKSLLKDLIIDKRITSVFEKVLESNKKSKMYNIDTNITYIFIPTKKGVICISKEYCLCENLLENLRHDIRNKLNRLIAMTDNSLIIEIANDVDKFSCRNLYTYFL